MAAAITGAGGSSPSSRQAPAGSTEELPPRVVLLASPGAGHLTPLVELARRLVADHGMAVTLAAVTGLYDSAVDAAVLSSVAACVDTAVLPAVAVDDLPADTDFGVLMFELARRSLPHVRAFMGSLSNAAAALVCDFFGTSALALAAELGVPGYVFFPNSFNMVSVMRHLEGLHGDAAASGEYRDLPDPLALPGCPPLRRADIPYGFHDRTHPVYAYKVEEARRYGGAAGFLVNSFEEMEPAAAEALRRDAEEGPFPPVYPVGPFVRSVSGDAGRDAADELGCMAWLDRQQARSVVYVSFGSGGALSVEQTAELAAGLETSGQRFLWVVRAPNVDGDPFALENPHAGDHPLAWLPEGFSERTRERGLAVTGWAPQARILSHPATAGFVSHCGWNSTMESVVAGVPMIAWPLYAEQKMNAATLKEVAGVALQPMAAREDGFVAREEVAAAVRELVEGEKGSSVRRRAKELQEAAARAWSPEGSSRRALDEVVRRWKEGPRFRNLNGQSA